MKRWKVEITYRRMLKNVFATHLIEELSELEEIVERGPDWNAIVNISIQVNRATDPGLTI